MGVIRAPWTPEQVATLREWQAATWIHPYTCPNRSDGNHLTTTDLGVLTPSLDGWRCASCEYEQDWAHDSGPVSRPSWMTTP